MKNFLITQSSEYDCGPTTLINALRFLFDRDRIPPALVRTVWLHTNDTYNEQGQKGCRGTSKACIRFLGEFFNDYGKHCGFPIRTAFMEEEGAAITKDSPTYRCLATGGVALMRCWLENCGHYVLLTGLTERGVLLFDPYEDTIPYTWEKDMTRVIADEPRRWNREVALERLNETVQHDYAMGEVSERENLLLWNTETELKA